MIKFFDFGFFISAFPSLIHELPTTLLVMVVSSLLGILLGIVIAVVNYFHIPVLHWLCRLFISFIRGTPTIVQLFISFFSVPAVCRLVGIGDVKSIPLITYAITTFVLNMGGYFAETLRGSLISVGTEQMEAAYSVGMTPVQSYVRILLPQAFTFALPDMFNLLITTLKNTALLFNIGLLDIMTRARQIGSATQRNLEVYLAAAIIFILLCLVLEQVLRKLEYYLRVKKYGQ